MIIRSTKISKTAFAIFGTIGSAIPFLDSVVYPGPESLVSGISLSLAISLAYIVFYSLQVLPSLSSAEPYSLLLSLPLEEREFSSLALLSFIRTFDYLAVSTTILQVIAVWLLTGSIVATFLMLIGALVNAIFAATIALWFSGLFYRNVTRGGRSKGATIGRFLFLITWGFAAMSIGFLFNFISYLLPFLNSMVAGSISQPIGLFFSILHPFSISLVITNVVYPSLLTPPLPEGSRILVPSFLPPVMAYTSAVVYIFLALGLCRRIFYSVSNIARGHDSRITRESPREFLLKLRSPFRAYIVKDLRLAAKNPSMAFLYALPLFVIVALAVITSQFPVMHVSAVIVSTIVGCSFTVMICSTLLNTDGAGLEYTLSLPMKTGTIINAKAFVATMTFIPVPLALLAIGLSKQLASNYSVLIPFVELLAVAAACMAQIGFFFNANPGGSGGQRRQKGLSVMAGSDITRFMESLAISFILLLIPIGAYVLFFFRTLSYPLSVGGMLLLATIELTSVIGIVEKRHGNANENFTKNNLKKPEMTLMGKRSDTPQNDYHDDKSCK